MFYIYDSWYINPSLLPTNVFWILGGGYRAPILQSSEEPRENNTKVHPDRSVPSEAFVSKSLWLVAEHASSPARATKRLQLGLPTIAIGVAIRGSCDKGCD